MKHKTLIRTRPHDGATEILVLVEHPMETGQRIDPKTKRKIPAHFIQTLLISVNGKPVAEADLSVAISKNPLLGVLVDGPKAGDTVTVSWHDNKGETGAAKAVVG
ncbi:MAG: thiosulfate oxidation carrier complex protein SoxZ [Pseudomonadota bacterium]|nr:thiosulfate oxidation carrier complex protein SoxZ [Pseudomonadota bacterium]